ncbi:MAG: hypothetical protein NTV81_00725 [Candidatus Komeilibacteria bacterium]|nr:hypothetical protein [Candidatus Komeilibacteria bacterium]
MTINRCCLFSLVDCHLRIISETKKVIAIFCWTQLYADSSPDIAVITSPDVAFSCFARDKTNIQITSTLLRHIIHRQIDRDNVSPAGWVCDGKNRMVDTSLLVIWSPNKLRRAIPIVSELIAVWQPALIRNRPSQLSIIGIIGAEVNGNRLTLIHLPIHRLCF